MVVTAMNAGLVLLLALFGFTVTQFAFQDWITWARGLRIVSTYNGQAIEGAGACVWFWDARHDSIEIGKEVEEALGSILGHADRVVQQLARLFASHRPRAIFAYVAGGQGEKWWSHRASSFACAARMARISGMI